MNAFHSRWDASLRVASRDRRSGQRAEILWRGEYRVVDPVASLEWRGCCLRDISDGGAAIEVDGEDLEVGQVLLVRLEPHPTYSRSWRQFRATVVNRRGRDHPPVYGLEFAGLLKTQRDLFRQTTMIARRNRLRRRRYKPDV